MSRSCDICGKGVMHGNKVSKSLNHTHRTWRPNLISVRADLGNGTVRRIKIGTRCYISNWSTKKVRVHKENQETN